jgi:hypothetical protein
MRFTFQVEPWADCVDEMRPLWQLHYKEIALDQELFKPDMDEPRYEAMQKAGSLHIVTARKESELIGYVICFVMPHFHYKSSGLVALADMYWVRPDCRNGCGVKLFVEMERTLKARGVVRSHMSCNVHFDQQALFERLGWRFTEKTFGKLL